ncbi:MAG: DUF192 domain-containing protein [Chloroflexota bacterium]|nr:DUF192 domain-containing protein [Chloroflexota bacterium]
MAQSRQVKIHNLSQPFPEPLQARYCDTFMCRLRGLTFRKNLPSNEGLLLVQARENRTETAIHMFFVCIDLAIIWVNTENKVVDTQLARQWHPLYVPQKPARYILEAAASRLSNFQIGDQLDFEETSVD